MITCDYLIIGSGFAGIGLKYKLMGKTILIIRIHSNTRLVNPIFPSSLMQTLV